MKELSLNILDITENSVKAGAKNISITIVELEDMLSLEVADDGCGMTEEFLKNVVDPFCTTRTTRKVGLGIPFLKMEAEMTGGSFAIESVHESVDSENHGTKTCATFVKNHIDFIPLGDIVSTMTTLIQGSPNIDFVFKHKAPKGEVELDTKLLRATLGEVPLNTFEVIIWIKEFLDEQYNSI